LNDVTASLVDLLRRGLDPNIQVEMHLAARACLLDGDETALRQALLNLATNARDALPAGGKITFATEWTPGAAGGRPRVAVVVKDNGMGMEPEVLRRLYEPFFTTKPPGKGTGLGCAIVFATVRAHGGVIECRSEPNKGTEFRLVFPAAAGVSQRSESAPDKAAPPRGTGTVLYVEDDETLRRVTTDLIAGLGYDVIPVPGGREAIEVARARRSSIDLALVDMTMPGMSGAEVFHTLRALDPSMRIILTSGFAAGDTARGLLGQGALALLQKPYRVTELARALERAKNTPRAAAAREIV
jgi:CheY-like chemotaxis protein